LLRERLLQLFVRDEVTIDQEITESALEGCGNLLAARATTPGRTASALWLRR
jgi:hypothetical protein